MTKLVQRLAAKKQRVKPNWKLPAKAIADVRAAIEVNKTGKAWISRERLARELQKAYSLPASLTTIKAAILEIAGGTW